MIDPELSRGYELPPHITRHYGATEVISVEVLHESGDIILRGRAGFILRIRGSDWATYRRIVNESHAKINMDPTT